MVNASSLQGAESAALHRKVGSILRSLKVVLVALCRESMVKRYASTALPCFFHCRLSETLKKCLF